MGVVGPSNVLVKGVLLPSNNREEQDIKGVEEGGPHKEVVEVMAVVAVEVVECHHSSSMVPPLNIRAGEEEGHPSKVVVDGTVVVVVAVAVVAVA